MYMYTCSFQHVHVHIHVYMQSHSIHTSVFPVPQLSSMSSTVGRSAPCHQWGHSHGPRHQTAQMSSMTAHLLYRDRPSRMTPVRDQIWPYQSVANTQEQSRDNINIITTYTIAVLLDPLCSSTVKLYTHDCVFLLINNASIWTQSTLSPRFCLITSGLQLLY